jgi:hypothetical protein
MHGDRVAERLERPDHLCDVDALGAIEQRPVVVEDSHV